MNKPRRNSHFVVARSAPKFSPLDPMTRPDGAPAPATHAGRRYHRAVQSGGVRYREPGCVGLVCWPRLVGVRILTSSVCFGCRAPPRWTCQPSPLDPLYSLLRHAPAGADSHPSENCTYHYNHLYPPHPSENCTHHYNHLLPPLTHLREDLLPTRLISERQTRPPSELELFLWLFLAGHRLDSTCTVRVFLALSRHRRPQAADTLADTRPGVITRDLPDGCQLVRRA